jgi:tRNA threonylcarbamoyladenosine modification (KEOPS) complex Cgi121 subunit
LLLEKLKQQDTSLGVAIGHLKNNRRLKKDDLVHLSTKKRQRVLSVQFLDPAFIAGDLHVLSAAQNAVNAWFGGYAVSRGLDVEIAVYASGQPQIGLALESMGLRDNMATLALVIIGDDDSAVKDAFEEAVDAVGKEIRPSFPMSADKQRKIMEHFGISETEINAMSDSDSRDAIREALCRCVASRVSMVAIGT